MGAGQYRIKDGVHRAVLLAAQQGSKRFPVLVLNIGGTQFEEPLKSCAAGQADANATAAVADATGVTAAGSLTAEVQAAMRHEAAAAVGAAADASNSSSPPIVQAVASIVHAIDAAQQRCAQKPECILTNESAILMFTPKGGLGNSFLGLGTAKLMAALLCRRFFVHWSNADDRQAGASFDDLLTPLPGVIGEWYMLLRFPCGPSALL